MGNIDWKLLRHIRERSVEVRNSGCWIWGLSANSASYGNVVRFASHFADGDGLNQNAHRLAYRAMFGEIPDHLEIDHTCGRKNCVNPHHMVVDHSTNIRRSRVAASHPPSTYWFGTVDLPLIPSVSDTGVVDGTMLSSEAGG